MATGATIATFPSQVIADQATGAPSRRISACIRKQRREAGGYGWRRVGGGGAGAGAGAGGGGGGGGGMSADEVGAGTGVAVGVGVGGDDSNDDDDAGTMVDDGENEEVE